MIPWKFAMFSKQSFLGGGSITCKNWSLGFMSRIMEISLIDLSLNNRLSTMEWKWVMHVNFFSNILTSYACWPLLDFRSIICLIGKGVYYLVYYNECIDPQSGHLRAPMYIMFLNPLEVFLYLLKFLHCFALKDRFLTIIIDFDPSII